MNRLLPMALCAALFAMPSPGAAKLVSTDAVIAAEHASAQRARVAAFLAREDVQGQMSALGVDVEEARARVDTLSDAEVAAIAGRLDELPAGQNTVGIIVGAALFVFIVLLITDLLGLTHVFPFT